MNKDSLNKAGSQLSQVLDQLLRDLNSDQKIGQILKSIMEKKNASPAQSLYLLEYILLNKMLDKKQKYVAIVLYLRICQDIPSKTDFIWKLVEMEASVKMKVLLYEMLILNSFDEV